MSIVRMLPSTEILEIKMESIDDVSDDSSSLLLVSLAPYVFSLIRFVSCALSAQSYLTNVKGSV